MVQQDLSVNLIGKDVSASAALNRLAAAARVAARSAGDSLDSMNRRVETSSQNSLKSVTGGFGSGLASWAQSGLAGILGGIAASVTSTVTNVVADAGNAVLSQLKSSVIDYNSTLENATIGFTTMLGSGKAASGFLDKLQDFGLKTPFQTDQLIQLSQQMMGYGVAAKNVIPYLTAIGDATAAAGRTDALPQATLAFEQMASRGRVDLPDMNQLTAAGVPALKILAGAYHTTTGGILDMIHTGKVMSSDALPKLINGIEKGTSKTAALGGMMEKQSQTFKGALSNISDGLNRSLGVAFKPMFNILEKGAISIEKFATSKSFQNWANSTGKTVGRAMGTIGKAVKSVFSDPAVQKSLGQLGKSLGNAFKQAGPALKEILPNLVKFGKDVLPTIIDAVKGVADKIPDLLNWWKRLSGVLADAGPTIAGVVGFLSDFGGTLFNIAKNIGNFVLDAVNNFKKLWPMIQASVSGIPGNLLVIGGQIVAGLVNGITGAWGGVMSTVTGLVNQIPLAVRKLLGIASPSKVFAEIGNFVGQGLSKGLLGSSSQISAAASSMATAIRTAFSNKQISKGVEQDALADLKRVTDSNSRLRKLASERDSIKAKLSDLKSARTGVHDDTLSATLGYGDVTQYGAATGDATRGLQALVTKTKTFTADLKKLVGKGVKGTLLTQLVDGWNSDPDNALATVQGLLANPTDLKQILGYESQLDTAGRALGAYAGHAEYDSQVNAAAGKAKVLTWEMQKAAASGLKTVSRDLHVHIAVNGTYAGTKTDLAKSITQEIRDAIKKGAIPKNWATA